jgi:16S rRNA A1518/A1519 N6-dimethyltransferase RsmA/KsgA/DIM1 with predicted DNA glycosylase/AP lyase activity
MQIRYWAERPPASFDQRTDIFLENANFQRTDAVIEVGVGMAQTTYKVAPRVLSVTGVDISDGLAEYLNSRKHVKNINFICADAGDPRSVGKLGGAV